MKKSGFISVLLSLFFFASCDVSDEYTVDPQANFEALWKLIDEKYCFFDYKGINWDAVYAKYSVQISDTMDRYQLFNVLGKMLAELQDGHTNLISSFNTSQFWNWHENYPDNFNPVVQGKYLGDAYKSIGELNCCILRNNFGYVYYGSFSASVSEADLDNLFLYFENCRGLIIDIRNNGGGSLVHSERIASRFVKEKLIVGYIIHKKSAGHNDFSDPYPIELEPSKRKKWLRPVAVLTNRGCYSAANDFVNKMKLFSQVKIIGDRTGGGCGLPFHSELPNGWSVRFSSSPLLDVKKEYTEYGIDPQMKVDIEEEDQLNNIDTIIEEALTYLWGETAASVPAVTDTGYINK
ncbi:MAG: S41 family peptidase [Tannerella sp.]|jgi:C-terminal processing protease CtpA/Prc|nr:S41 family peptidase [Tannerella sp.]